MNLEQTTKHIADRQQKELLKEIHHRINNNFQMITSFFALHSRRVQNPELKSILSEASSRIHTMAAIHQKLYEENNYNQLNISAFLKDIIQKVKGTDELILDIDEMEDVIHFEQAIHLAIVVHELVTNSIKYAWNNNDKDRKISLQLKVDDKALSLHYADNGRGLPEGFGIKNTTTYGLFLIDLLVHHQLNGQLDFYNQQGANFIIQFQLLA